MAMLSASRAAALVTRGESHHHPTRQQTHTHSLFQELSHVLWPARAPLPHHIRCLDSTIPVLERTDLGCKTPCQMHPATCVAKHAVCESSASRLPSACPLSCHPFARWFVLAVWFGAPPMQGRLPPASAVVTLCNPLGKVDQQSHSDVE